MNTPFRNSWINLLNKAATGTKKSRALLTPVGVLLFSVFTGLFVLAALLIDLVICEIFLQ